MLQDLPLLFNFIFSKTHGGGLYYCTPILKMKKLKLREGSYLLKVKNILLQSWYLNPSLVDSKVWDLLRPQLEGND